MLDMINRCYNDPNGENSRKPLKWILIDSIIIGLLALVAVMPVNIPTEVELWVMFKAFIAALVFQLAVERGIKRKKKEE